jgi:group I intron endonuclease
MKNIQINFFNSIKKESGIYKITNLINNKFYIGSAVNLRIRYVQHFNTLIKNKHKNKKLENSVKKYGFNNFKFEILVTCPKEYLLKLEQWFIDNLKPEYNIAPIAGSSLGIKRTKETKRKIKESHKTRTSYNISGLIKYRKENPGKSIGNPEKTKKSVDKYDLKGNFIENYKGVKEAAIKNKFKSYTGISAVCNNKAKTAGGFKWIWSKKINN